MKMFSICIADVTSKLERFTRRKTVGKLPVMERELIIRVYRENPDQHTTRWRRSAGYATVPLRPRYSYSTSVVAESGGGEGKMWMSARRLRGGSRNRVLGDSRPRLDDKGLGSSTAPSAIRAQFVHMHHVLKPSDATWA